MYRKHKVAYTPKRMQNESYENYYHEGAYMLPDCTKQSLCTEKCAPEGIRLGCVHSYGSTTLEQR